MNKHFRNVFGTSLGAFPPHADAPRVVVTNGMIPNYSGVEDYERSLTR